ncbi:hypothetical protein OEZ82_25660, partial [Leclercia adecarboxylata]|uniref:hypothetical protein n=1 Tax=Leclercia adecarboxylata TaxID=83655 RepID=UPI00234C4810
YMLYNFKDDPDDLFVRMWLNLALNEELGIRIWSFPMRYQPTDLPERTYVSTGWSRYELRSLQIVLQATHGVVSGEPVFFRRAFGESSEEFRAILAMHQHFIFKPEWYERHGGRAEFDTFQSAYRRLTPALRAGLIARLSSRVPSQFAALVQDEIDPQLKRILPFYVPIRKDTEREIWKARSSKSLL